jgi:hypothetical protein
MQLDADDSSDPFYKPAPQPSAPETRTSGESAAKPTRSEESNAGAAAAATIEQEA